MGNSGAFELVTGHGAEPHVDADDHALLYASFIGSGVYRLTGVKTAEIEVTSENEVTISPGMFLIHGRFARVKDPISLSIETGSQGQNRNDLVVCEYSYSGNETEIDDMELVVVTGTPANPGSETDPSIEDDLTLFDIEYGGSITDETIIQVPLWRVPKEGLTTQDPVALFKDYVDATTARSSIAPTNWITLLQGGACYNKDGNTVTVQVYNCTAYSNRERVVGTLPEEFRPTKAIEGSSTIGAMNDVAAAGHLAFLQVELDGTVTLGRLAGTDTNAAVTGQVSFVIA